MLDEREESATIAPRRARDTFPLPLLLRPRRGSPLARPVVSLLSFLRSPLASQLASLVGWAFSPACRSAFVVAQLGGGGEEGGEEREREKEENSPNLARGGKAKRELDLSLAAAIKCGAGRMEIHKDPLGCASEGGGHLRE